MSPRIGPIVARYRANRCRRGCASDEAIEPFGLRSTSRFGRSQAGWPSSLANAQTVVDWSEGVPLLKVQALVEYGPTVTTGDRLGPD